MQKYFRSYFCDFTPNYISEMPHTLSNWFQIHIIKSFGHYLSMDLSSKLFNWFFQVNLIEIMLLVESTNKSADTVFDCISRPVLTSDLLRTHFIDEKLEASAIRPC